MSFMEELKSVERREAAYPKEKQQLTESLMSYMDEEVETNMRNDEDFDRAYREFNVLELWRIAENAATGQGAVAVHIIILKLLLNRGSTKLLNLKQERGKFANYLQEFKETVATLRRQGTAEELLQMILNTLFVTRADQEEFATQIAAVKGTVKWKDYDELGGEWRVFSSTTKGLQSVERERSEGMVRANVAAAAGGGVKTYPRNFVCHNCGKTGADHSSWNCPEPPHRCSNCGKNHLEEFCRLPRGARDAPERGKSGRGDAPNRPPPRNPTRPGAPTPRLKAPPSHKSTRRAEALRSAQPRANLSCADDYDQDIEEGYGEGDEYDEDVYSNHLTTITEVSPTIVTSLPAMVMEQRVDTTDDLDRIEFIVDSGCNKAHLTRHPRLLGDAVETDSASIQGVTGHRIPCTHRGSLPVPGKAIGAPAADADLLSLKLLCRDGGSFQGDYHTLNVYDKDGRLIVPAKDDGEGFWTVSYGALLRLNGPVADTKALLAKRQQFCARSGRLPKSTVAPQRGAACPCPRSV
jgi:hypothetical protein